jgi:hypothetical protein
MPEHASYNINCFFIDFNERVGKMVSGYDVILYVVSMAICKTVMFVLS